MPNIVIVGAQWGDEGKGKVVDLLAPCVDVVARYSGGPNAGHTVVAGGRRFVLQLLPSGVLRPGKRSVIGCGTVVDPAALVGELEGLVAAGIGVTLVPESVRSLRRDNVVYRGIMPPAPVSELSAVHRMGDESPVLAAFLTVMREKIAS